MLPADTLSCIDLLNDLGYIERTVLRTEIIMAAINATNARKNLYKLIKEVGESHEPVTITGKDSSAVLVNEDDWHAIQETLYLLSVPGMADSIREGLKTPVSECDDEVNW